MQCNVGVCRQSGQLQDREFFETFITEDKLTTFSFFKRTGGGDWREEHGLTRNSNNSGPLYDIPDYRFEDGKLVFQ